MKRFQWIILTGISAALASCQSNSSTDQVVSQTFVHKYGFDLSEREWEEREGDGQVVSTLKNGVKITRSYENGQLHGLTTHTFPNSSVIEKNLLYDQGTLLKETLNDPNGMPIREELYEFDDRTIVTVWNEKGVPLSVEEYEDDALREGDYYTPEHQLECKVEGGFGNRVKRDRNGSLLSRDKIEQGQIASRLTYHPNGEIQTVSHFQDYKLHGEQLKFTTAGKPLMTLHWNQGELEGVKVVYRNGYKVAEIPYAKGLKQGTELHYDDFGNLIAEIEWKDDKKHGSSQSHSEDETNTEWFFKGQSVNAERFQILETRDKIIADFSQGR